MRQAGTWLLEDREPTPSERVDALRMPRRIVAMHIWIWLAAAVVFGALNAADSLEAGRRVSLTIVAGGLVTCAFVYLLAERQLRRSPPARSPRGSAIEGWRPASRRAPSAPGRSALRSRSSA